MKMTNKGFTLIELIMVTIILGILAAVAIPRYMTSVNAAEAAAEDAVISAITAGLESHATEKLMSEGRRYWPSNPFSALATPPATYNANATGQPTSDGEWTFAAASGGAKNGKIYHRRNDNSIHEWTYKWSDEHNSADDVGDDTGTLSGRTETSNANTSAL